MADQEKVLLMDALNAFYRAWIIDPSLTPNGRPVGGVRTFLRILQKQLREHKPDEVCIVWDGAGGSKRKKDMADDYKEGRSPPSLNRAIEGMLDEQEKKENRAWQHIRLVKYLNDMPFKQFRYDNVEADDVIAYLVQEDIYEDAEKIIVSNDQDFIQLLHYDNTKLWRPTSGEMLTKEKVVEDYDIHPSNFTLARAMVGDDSDNIEGVYGIGMKTAARDFDFLSENQDYYLEDVFEHAKEHEGKYKSYERVLENRQKVRQNYKLQQLYEPLLSPEVKEDIRDVVDSDAPSFDRLSIRKRMMDDDIFEDTWTDLMSYCRQHQIEEES